MFYDYDYDYDSVSLQWLHIWNHSRVRIQEFIISIFTASDIPLQAFSDFTKVSRSPIIRSIRLLAAHATVVSRHRTLPAEHTVRSAPSFTSTPPTQIRSERNYVTSKSETRFWPYPKPKNRFYRTNPVLETLLSQSPMNWGDQWNYNSQVASNLFWRHVTTTFDLLAPKVDRHIPLPHEPLVAICSKIGSFSQYHIHKISNERTKGRFQNIMPPPSLYWRKHSKERKEILQLLLQQQ